MGEVVDEEQVIAHLEEQLKYLERYVPMLARESFFNVMRARTAQLLDAPVLASKLANLALRQGVLAKRVVGAIEVYTDHGRCLTRDGAETIRERLVRLEEMH